MGEAAEQVSTPPSQPWDLGLATYHTWGKQDKQANEEKRAETTALAISGHSWAGCRTSRHHVESKHAFVPLPPFQHRPHGMHTQLIVCYTAHGVFTIPEVWLKPTLQKLPPRVGSPLIIKIP